MTIDIASGKYRFFTRGNNNTLYSADATVGPNDSWQHIVAVYDQSDPSSPELRIYVNGELSDSSPGRPQGLRSSSSPVSIGSKRMGTPQDTTEASDLGNLNGRGNRHRSMVRSRSLPAAVFLVPRGAEYWIPRC